MHSVCYRATSGPKCLARLLAQVEVGNGTTAANDSAVNDSAANLMGDDDRDSGHFGLLP